MNSDLWPITAMVQIQAASSLRDALLVSSGYLTEIWNELIRFRGREDLKGMYDALIKEELLRDDLKMLPDGDRRPVMWGMGGVLLEFSDWADNASDDELLSEAIRVFRQDENPDELSDDSVDILLREDFCVILFAHHKWLLEETG